MAFLRKFPRKFNPWIPRTEWPYCEFFQDVQTFLDQPRKWNFSKKEKVDLFNKGLTKAIHKDVDEAKTQFSQFRYKLESVENAFFSLDKAYFFLDDFDKFSDYCLGRSFQWTEFEDYVVGVMKRVTYYQKMKFKSYSVSDDPTVWPDYLNYRYQDVTIPLEDIAPKVKISSEIGPMTRLTPGIAKKTLDNFELTVRIYEKLIDNCLTPQFMIVILWLSSSLCWLPIKNEFQAAHDKFMGPILNRKEEYSKEKEAFETLLKARGFADDRVDLRNAARRSIDLTIEAVHDYYEEPKVQQQIMLNAVVKAYMHALDVLEAFVPLVTTKNWSGNTTRAEVERLNAAAAVFEWKNHLEDSAIDKLEQSTTLVNILSGLPELYDCITKFTFTFHSPY